MNRMIRIAGASAVLLMLVLLYILNPVLPTPAGPQGAILYQPGELGLTTEELELIDHTRETMASGGFDGHPFRELNGKLSLPENQDQGPYPLIIYSHGFMSSVKEADYLMEFLVPKGYVIAAVNYPLSNWRSPGGPTVSDVLSQAGDVSYVIDTLLARNSTEGDSLYGFIDSDRIAAIGLSLGGLTSQLAAFHRDLRDPRLAAVVSIAGPAAFLSPEFFSTSRIPFMMIAGTADAIVPYEENAATVPDKAQQALLVTLKDASHFGFARGAGTFLRWSHNPDELACPILLWGLKNGQQQGEIITPSDAAIGITSEAVKPCTETDYQRALRPGEQRMLTRLAVYAFLESLFARDPDRQKQMENFLINDLPGEQPAVSLSVRKTRSQ